MNLQKSASLNFRLFSFRFLLEKDFTEEIEDIKLYIEKIYRERGKNWDKKRFSFIFVIKFRNSVGNIRIELKVKSAISTAINYI